DALTPAAPSPSAATTTCESASSPTCASRTPCPTRCAARCWTEPSGRRRSALAAPPETPLRRMPDATNNLPLTPPTFPPDIPGAILAQSSLPKAPFYPLNTSSEHHRFTLARFEARRFANLCGQFDEHLRLIERRRTVEIRNRGNQFELVGDKRRTQNVENHLRRLYRKTMRMELSPELVHLFLQESAMDELATGK